MSISEQVKELRNTSDNICILKLDGYAKIISEAADTIEALSAKLQATNEEFQKGNYSIGDLSELIDKFDNEKIKGITDFEQVQIFNALKYLDMYQKVGMIEKFMELKQNMERPAEDCGGWIYCGDGENLPTEPFACIVTVIDTEPMTQTDFESILPYHVGYDGKQWNDIEGNRIPFEVIAWMYVSKEPYHEP